MAEEIKCTWGLGTPCGGEHKKRDLFGKVLVGIPMCDKHFQEHTEIVILCSSGHDIEEVVDMPPEERKRLALTVALSGMTLDDEL